MMIFTALVLAGLVVCLVFDLAKTDVLFIGALILFLFGGIVTPQEALSGFSNKGMITVALLFVVSQAIQNTGIFQRIAEMFLSGTKKAGTSLTLMLLKIMLPVSFLSAFLNNTPIVTIFTPVIKRWAVSRKIPASKFLIPLSYATILGGLCTLIGTSTNLVVHGLMLQEGDQGFSFFELAKVGIPLAIVGILYLIGPGRLLLPDRKNALNDMSENPKEYIIEMRIPKGSVLIGKTVEQARLRNLEGVFLSDIFRAGAHLGPPGPDQQLEEDDHLFFAGQTSAVADILSMEGLESDLSAKPGNGRNGSHFNLLESVVSETSPIIGKTLKESRFRSLYDAAVVALSRNGERINKRLGSIVIKPGDNLILLSGDDFLTRYQHSRDFYLISSLTRLSGVSRGKSIFTLIVTLLMIVLSAVGDIFNPFPGRTIDMFLTASGAVFLLVAGRTLTISQARESIRWDILITIGAAFGISKGLVNSGLAGIAGGAIVELFTPLGAVGALAAVMLATSLFTEIITNNAAAALMFPIALATAEKAGIPLLPFGVAVAIGASSSFATPVGYQTNLIVQGAGGYRFSDFMKVGIPMNIIVLAVGTLAIAFWYGLL